MCRATLWLLLSVIMVADLRAQTAQRMLLPVKINEIAHGEALAYIDGDDIFVARSFLEPLQIPLDHAVTKTIDNEPYVSLKSLAPKISFAFDPNEVQLSITADPSLLGKHVLELHRGTPVPDNGGDPSLFFNYAVAGPFTATPSIFTELGASSGQRFAYTALSRTSTGDFVRGLSYLNFEWPQDLRRLTIGDVFAGTDALGGSVTIGGVTLSRQFSLQPYFIRTPGLDVTGAATTPSTVEVYVNGQLTNRISVEPGMFTLHDLPVTAGLGDTQLVIRDAFGRETVVQRSFYYSNVALRQGLSDYTFSAGSIRNSLTESFDYGEAAGLAQYRRGITDNLTVGGRAEASKDVVSGGPSVTLATHLGDFDAEVAASSGNGASGTAGSFDYRFNAPRYSFGLTAVDRSDRYATLSLTPDLDRPVRDWSVFAATNIHNFSFGVTVLRTDLRDGERSDSVAFQANAALGRWGSVFSSVGTSRQNGRTQPEILLGLTLGIGRQATVNAQVQRSQGKDGARFEIRKPLGLANGYGYDISTDTISNQQFAALQYQTSYGEYELTSDPKKPRDTAYDFSGGIIALDGFIRPTRAVADGFALARVGVPGVHVFASNQEVGTTDSAGDLLVSHLLPHYANELRISDKDVPIDYEVTGTVVTVVPPTRGGVIARFPVHRLHSYTGKVSFNIIGTLFTPGLGEIVVDRKGIDPTVLSLGRGGEFYVEDLDPGTYPASLRIGKVHCDFPLVLPKSDAGLTDLGVISCGR